MKKGMKSLVAILVMLGCISFVWGGNAILFAEETDYPTKTIEIYVGFSPGGSQDTTGRVFAQVLERQLGVPVIIINKPGASGSIGLSHVAQAKPDGYTLCYPLAPFELLKKIEEPSLPFSSEDLTFLGSFHRYYVMVTVRADSPWATFQDFVEYGRKNVIKFASAGAIQRVCQAELGKKYGIQVKTIPYPGGGPSVRALLGGHVDAVTISSGPTGAYVRSGDLKWLVHLGPERNPVYDHIPSIKEMPYDEALYNGGWTIFVGPKGLPKAVAAKLNEELQRAAQSKEVRKQFHVYGWDYKYLTPEQCVKEWEADKVYFTEQLKELGIID